MSDIIRRLDAAVEISRCGGVMCNGPLLQDAAAEILRLRAGLAALREPAGDVLVEVAARAIDAALLDERNEDFHDIARTALDAVLPRVRAEGWRTMETPRTDAEVMEALRSDTPLNRARRVFSGACGRIEQAAMQRRPAGSIETRRMEFEAVVKIAESLAPSPLPDAAP